MVDAKPTVLRVQALMGMGWSLTQLGREVWPQAEKPRQFRDILNRTRVTRGTALRVAEVFGRLWNVDGGSLRAVNHAIGKGWKIADPEVVARLVAGIATPHNKVERDVAIRIVARDAENFPSLNVIALHVGARLSIVRRVLNDAA